MADSTKQYAAPKGQARLLFEVNHQDAEVLVTARELRFVAATLVRGGANNLTVVDDEGNLKSPQDYPDAE